MRCNASGSLTSAIVRHFELQRATSLFQPSLRIPDLIVHEEQIPRTGGAERGRYPCSVVAISS